jgi:putative ABC transport system ATP-binding protein
VERRAIAEPPLIDFCLRGFQGCLLFVSSAWSYFLFAKWTSMAQSTLLLRCDHVSRVYPDGNITALGDVSLEVQQGEYIAIMGPSGSGKSTLLNLISGLDRPTSGEVYFEERPLSEQAHLDQVRINKIGFIFQAFYLLPTLTAVENVQIPMFEGPLPAPQRRAKAHRLLESVGMGQRLNHLPSKLSGGERQRVAIARALANDPVLLLADEPTGNLDTATGTDILNLFDRLHAEHHMALILVTHSPEVGERAHRLIRMRDGKIVEDKQQK